MGEQEKSTTHIFSYQVASSMLSGKLHMNVDAFQLQLLHSSSDWRGDDAPHPLQIPLVAPVAVPKWWHIHHTGLAWT